MSESHPLASRTEVNVEELAEHQVLRIPLPPEFADSWTPPSTPAGRRIRRAYREVYHVEELPRLLRDDGLVHITIVELPRLIDLPGLVTIPLHGMPPLLCTVMVSPPPTSPQVLHFIDVTAGCRLPASWDNSERFPPRGWGHPGCQ